MRNIKSFRTLMTFIPTSAQQIRARRMKNPNTRQSKPAWKAEMHLAPSNSILVNKHCSPLLPLAKRYPQGSQHKFNSFHSSSLQQPCHFCDSLSSAVLISAGCTQHWWEQGRVSPQSKILQGGKEETSSTRWQVWDTHCAVCNIHQASISERPYM